MYKKLLMFLLLGMFMISLASAVNNKVISILILIDFLYQFP